MTENRYIKDFGLLHLPDLILDQHPAKRYDKHPWNFYKLRRGIIENHFTLETLWTDLCFNCNVTVISHRAVFWKPSDGILNYLEKCKRKWQNGSFAFVISVTKTDWRSFIVYPCFESWNPRFTLFITGCNDSSYNRMETFAKINKCQRNTEWSLVLGYVPEIWFLGLRDTSCLSYPQKIWVGLI